MRKLVKEMGNAANAATVWVKDKILPWAIILMLGTILTMAGSIIKLQGQIENLKGQIEISMLKTTKEIIEKQAENAQFILRVEAISRENKAIIDMILKNMNGMKK